MPASGLVLERVDLEAELSFLGISMEVAEKVTERLFVPDALAAPFRHEITVLEHQVRHDRTNVSGVRWYRRSDSETWGKVLIVSKVRHHLLAVFAITVLLLGACGDDDDDSSATDVGGGSPSAPAEDEPAGDDAPADDDAPAPSGGSSGTASFDGEELSIANVRCFFEEQPRAGLGGVFTHSLQASGTNAEGTEIVIDMTRAVGEDGTVEDDISYDVGDPFGDEARSYAGGGPEGTIDFAEDGASATDLELKDLDAFDDVHTLSFDLSC